MQPLTVCVLNPGSTTVKWTWFRSIDLGPERCFSLGYINQGGTLDTNGLLRANGCDIETVSMAVIQRFSYLDEVIYDKSKR